VVVAQAPRGGRADLASADRVEHIRRVLPQPRSSRRQLLSTHDGPLREHDRPRRHADRRCAQGASLGYHDHYCVDGGRTRIILCALVIPADVMENEPMVDVLRRVTCRWRLHPRHAVADTTYGTLDDIRALEDAGICACVPLPDFDGRTYQPLPGAIAATPGMERGTPPAPDRRDADGPRALPGGYAGNHAPRRLSTATLGLIPVIIVFLIFQRQLITGITSVAFKGWSAAGARRREYERVGVPACSEQTRSTTGSLERGRAVPPLEAGTVARSLQPGFGWLSRRVFHSLIVAVEATTKQRVWRCRAVPDPRGERGALPSLSRLRWSARLL